MSQPLVLITGGTGHIGFATLALLLKKGYRARIASRKLSTVEKLKDLPSIKPYTASISFVEIPDFLAEHAFDEAVKDVDYIMHVASPIPDPDTIGSKIDVRKTYVEPAIQGNLGVLKAASKSPSVKRIVITGSVSNIESKDGSLTVGPDDIATPLDISEYENTTNPWFAYSQSKRQAYAAAQRFVEENKLHFDVVHIFPSFVQGRNEPLLTAQELIDRVSSNSVMVKYVLGEKSEEPRPTDLVLVDDVAATHVAALESKNVTNGERFIAAYPPMIEWNEIDPVVRKLFPKEVEQGILPLGGHQPGHGFIYDSSKTTEKFGIKFQGLEAMVQSLIGQLVELKAKELKN